MVKKRFRKKGLIQALLLPGLLMGLIAGTSTAAALTGDLNNDGTLDLADAITGMKVLTDQTWAV